MPDAEGVLAAESCFQHIKLRDYAATYLVGL